MTSQYSISIDSATHCKIFQSKLVKLASAFAAFNHLILPSHYIISIFSVMITLCLFLADFFLPDATKSLKAIELKRSLKIYSLHLLSCIFPNEVNNLDSDSICH